MLPRREVQAARRAGGADDGVVVLTRDLLKDTNDVDQDGSSGSDTAQHSPTPRATSLHVIDVTQMS